MVNASRNSWRQIDGGFWSIRLESGWQIDSDFSGSKIEELIDGKTWKTIGETNDARFFHRVLPIGNGRLLAIGGANMDVGKFTECEIISPAQRNN